MSEPNEPGASGAHETPPATPSANAPAPGGAPMPVGAPIPGWASPGSQAPELGSPLGDGPAAAPAPRRPKAVVLGAVGLVAALAATIAIKVLPFFAAGVVATALSGAFGGPWDRLPADVRNGYEQRLEAAVGNRFDGLSDAETGKRVEKLIFDGMLRLGDERLVRHLELQIDALHRTGDATCASFGRQSFGGVAIADATSDALISSLETNGLVEWIGINVEAIEAETRGSPDKITVAESEVNRVFEAIVGGMTETELATISAINSGGTATDADVCAAIRSLYDKTQVLEPTLEAIMARYDIQP